MAFVISVMNALAGSIATIVVGAWIRPIWRAAKLTRLEDPIPENYAKLSLSVRPETLRVI